MMKALERLRQMKTTAVDRMAQLNGLAATEKRDLTETEQQHYNAAKAEAEEYVAAIEQLKEASQSGSGELAQILAQIETLSREISQRDGLTKEAAVVRVINANPKFYDLYLESCPAQTGREK